MSPAAPVFTSRLDAERRELVLQLRADLPGDVLEGVEFALGELMPTILREAAPMLPPPAEWSMEWWEIFNERVAIAADGASEDAADPRAVAYDDLRVMLLRGELPGLGEAAEGTVAAAPTPAHRPLPPAHARCGDANEPAFLASVTARRGSMAVHHG